MTSGIIDQLQGITFNDLEANQLNAAIGKAYLNALKTSSDAQNVLAGWRATHVPTSGAPIPKSESEFSSALSVASTVILTPEPNEVYLILGMSYANANVTDPATVRVELVGPSATVLIDDGTTLAPSGGASAAFCVNTQRNIYVTKDAALQVTVTDGTPSDVSVEMIAIKVVQ